MNFISVFSPIFLLAFPPVFLSVGVTSQEYNPKETSSPVGLRKKCFTFTSCN